MLYTDLKKKYFIHKLVIFAVLVFVCILSITIGIAKIDAVDTVRILASKIPVIGKNVNVDNIPSSAKAIILNIRAPRIVMAVFVGMGLSLSGAVYQGMFKNQMADPYVWNFFRGCLFCFHCHCIFQWLAHRCFRQCLHICIHWKRSYYNSCIHDKQNRWKASCGNAFADRCGFSFSNVCRN